MIFSRAKERKDKNSAIVIF